MATTKKTCDLCLKQKSLACYESGSNICIPCARDVEVKKHVGPNVSGRPHPYGVQGAMSYWEEMGLEMVGEA